MAYDISVERLFWSQSAGINAWYDVHNQEPITKSLQPMQQHFYKPVYF